MLYGYITGKATQDLIVQNFSRGANAQVLHIKHFERNGIPKNATGVIFAGILRGCADLMKAAESSGVDYYFIDHAYMKGGKYVPPYWMRVTKNGFVQNRIITAVDKKRFKRYFEQPMSSWNYANKKKIIILPPTYAIQYALGAHKWLSKVTSSLEARIHNTGLTMHVHEKGDMPIVDPVTGQFKGRTPKRKETIDWESYIKNEAYCVVAFNSKLALDSLRWGVPVITTRFCPAFPVTNSPNDIQKLKTCNRDQLFQSLSIGQFSIYEMRNGHAYNQLQQINQVVKY